MRPILLPKIHLILPCLSIIQKWFHNHDTFVKMVKENKCTMNSISMIKTTPPLVQQINWWHREGGQLYKLVHVGRHWTPCRWTIMIILTFHHHHSYILHLKVMEVWILFPSVICTILQVVLFVHCLHGHTSYSWTLDYEKLAPKIFLSLTMLTVINTEILILFPYHDSLSWYIFYTFEALRYIGVILNMLKQWLHKRKLATHAHMILSAETMSSTPT